MFHVNVTLKLPSAWVPIALTLFILVVMNIALSTSGLVHEADEGTVAHLFQIWLALEVLSIIFFGVKWLPRHPKQAAIILGLQIVLALVPLVIVHTLNL